MGGVLAQPTGAGGADGPSPTARPTLDEAEMKYEGHPFLQLTGQEVVALICSCAPDMKEDKDAIRRFLATNLADRTETLTGFYVLEMHSRICARQEHMRERAMQVVTELLGQSETREFTRLLSLSVDAVRDPVSMLQSLFHKVVLMSAHVRLATGGVETRLEEVIPREWRTPAFDCFYTEGSRWVIQSGDLMRQRNKKGMQVQLGSYPSPAGWLRLALDLEITAANKVRVEELQRWHKAYHGTAGRNLTSIIENGLLPPRMDAAGNIQHKHGCAGAKGPTIYCSPSLEYAANYLFTKEDAHLGRPSVLPDEDPRALDHENLRNFIQEAGGAWSQFVFELRIKPGSYEIQGNTLGANFWPHWDLLYDPDCSSHNLELLITDADNVVCTGVMVRTLSASPSELNKKRIKEMKELVGWDDDKKKPTRPRVHGGVPEGQAGRWEFNGNSTETLSMADGPHWVRYDDETSKIIEAAYKEYRRTCFIGKPAGSQFPYAIDFGRLCEEGAKYGPMQMRADACKEHTWRRRAVRRVPL